MRSHNKVAPNFLTVLSIYYHIFPCITGPAAPPLQCIYLQARSVQVTKLGLLILMVNFSTSTAATELKIGSNT